MDKVEDLKKALNKNEMGTPEDTEQDFYDIDDASPDLLGSPTLEEKSEGFWTGCAKTVFWPITFLKMKFYAGSMKGSVFTLMTATLGAGILSLPLALFKSGIVWGIIQFIFSGLISFYTTYILIQSAEKSGHKTYMALLRHYYPVGTTKQKVFFVFAKITMFFNNWGTIVSYIVLENKLFAKGTFFLAESSAPDFLTDPNGKFWASLFIVLIVYPLTFSRTYSKLNFVFVIGVFFMIYVTIVVVVLSFSPQTGSFSDNIDNVTIWDWSGTTKTFGIAVFAYACHPNVPDIYVELLRPSRRRMTKVLTRGLSTVFILYMFAGFFGYITFASNTAELTDPNNGGIILMADYNKNLAVIIAIFMIGLSVLCAVIVVMRPSKDSLLEIFSDKPCEELPAKWHYLGNTFCCVTALAASYVIPTLDEVLELMGVTFYPLTSFTFPLLFFLRFNGYKKMNFKRRCKIGFSWFLLILMSLYIPFGVTLFVLRKVGTIS